MEIFYCFRRDNCYSKLTSVHWFYLIAGDHLFTVLYTKDFMSKHLHPPITEVFIRKPLRIRYYCSPGFHFKFYITTFKLAEMLDSDFFLSANYIVLILGLEKIIYS